MSGAQVLPVREIARLPLMGDEIALRISGGLCWLRFETMPPLPGKGPEWQSRCAGPATAAEMRALADALDRIDWAGLA